jgi:hypothetical protein
MPRFNGATYRVAVVLNNIGVSLLEMAEYQQALETFKGSINIFRQMYFPGNGPLSDHRDGSVLRRMVQLADQQLAAAFIPASTSACATSNIGVRSISYDGTSFHGLDLVSDHADTSAKYVPARIELFPSNFGENFGCPFSENRASHGLDFQCALVVYNLALAHLCLADEVSSTGLEMPDHHSEIGIAVPLQRCAVRLLRMVQSILFSSVEDNMVMTLWMKEARSALTCLSMMHIAQAVQQNGSSTEVQETFDQLSSAVDEWLQWNNFLTRLLGDSATDAFRDCETDNSQPLIPALPLDGLKLKWMKMAYRKFAAQAAGIKNTLSNINVPFESH